MASENKSTAFLLGKDPHHYTSAPTSDTDDESVPDHSDHLLSQRNSLCKRSFPYIIHFLLILSYSLIFAISWSRNAPRDSLGIPYVDTVFEVNPKLNRSIARIYTGPPSDDLDEAWDNLLQYANVRVPEQTIRDLDRLDQAVRFTDGSGYFAQMTAYHHLHCIKRLHHFLHREHYWPNATDDDLYLLRAHNYHCLDTLRQAVMCQGDTSLITFRWGKSQPVPLGNFSTPHQCRDWKALDKWNQDHYVDVFQPGLVVHPTLGPAYAHLDEDSGTGVTIDD